MATTTRLLSTRSPERVCDCVGGFDLNEVIAIIEDEKKTLRSSHAACSAYLCRDVESSSHWYRRLLGCESGHGGIEYKD